MTEIPRADAPSFPPNRFAFIEQEILLAKIRTDGGTQHRAFTDEETIERYKEDMAAGHIFPPVDVYWDGKHYWLADGFHRVLAAHELALRSFPARIHRGTLRDAVLFAMGANAVHGKPRTNMDKRQCVEKILRDPEWGAYTDAWVAEKARVSTSLVLHMRRELKIAKPNVRIARGGRKIDTSKLGKHQRHEKKKPSAEAAPPEAKPITPPSPPKPEPANYLVVRNQVDRLVAEDLVLLREHITGLLQMMGAA
jgi:ParB-like nuclease domain